MATRFTKGNAAYPFPLADKSPQSWALAERLDDAAAKLVHQLTAVDVQGLNVSEYFKRYFTEHMRHALPSMQVYAHILYLSLRGIGADLADISIVDYGAGTGLLSMLAKQSGVGTVIYNDIYDVSCADARTLAVAAGLEADYYVEGGLDDLASFARTNSLRCRVVASYDVIEHIYDIRSYLEALPSLSAGPLRVVMASTANKANRPLAWLTMRAQKRLETVDRQPVYGHKARDTTRAYREIRREIIQRHAPALPANEVDDLVVATRGQMEGDIEKSVDAFVTTRSMPAAPKHPTNTCDPYTGNWAEHLMEPRDLASILTSVGIPTTVRSGYWGDHPQLLKRVPYMVLNAAIRLKPRSGLPFAPYYILYGERT